MIDGLSSSHVSKVGRANIRALLDAGQPVPAEYISAVLNTLDFAERFIDALHSGWEKADQRNAGIITGLQMRSRQGRDGRSRKRAA